MAQVESAHYEFSKYVSKERWVSFYHQMVEVLKFVPESVLELGPGPGILNTLLSKFGVETVTVDHAPDLWPDVVASGVALPFVDNQFDCTCAFQVLEHLSYEDSLKVFAELVRVARKGVVVSLPNAAILWPFSVYIPTMGVRYFHVSKPTRILGTFPLRHKHYWEIGRPGYSRDKIVGDFLKEQVDLKDEHRVKEFPYHHFFVFNKNMTERLGNGA